MRVTEQGRVSTLLRNMNTRSERLNDVYEQLSTQKKINTASDDPVGTGTVMRMTSQLKQLQQTVQSIQSAQHFADATGEALDGSEEIITRTRTLAAQAGNGSLSDTERDSIADELNQLIESLVQYGNQQFEGRYIFSGTRSDTMPLVTQRNADGEITTVTYAGSDQPLNVPLGRGRVLDSSIPGESIFLDNDLLPSLLNLRDALRNTGGLSADDQTALIAQTSSRLSDAGDKFTSAVGVYSARVADLDLLLEQTQNASTRAQEVISNVQDADLANVAMQLNQEQTVYQAILSVGSRIMSVSLLDYLQ